MSESAIVKTTWWQNIKNMIFPPSEDDVKKGQSPKAEFLFERKAVIRKPTYDYVQIYDETIKSWVYRQVARAISQEVLNPEVVLKKKYVLKCSTCGMEYDVEVEECQVCGGKKFTSPDISQRKTAQGLMDQPNSQYSFDSFMRSALNWHIMLDDTYISIAYKEFPRSSTETDENGKQKMVIKQVKTPAEVFVEDSRFMLPITDELGALGNNEYFCPKCYNWEIDNIQVPATDGKIPTTCEKCQGPLLRTCYVMKMNKQIRQRYGCQEIVMENTEAMRPQLFGNPKIISVWKLLKTINNMDDYNEEVFKEGTVGAMIAFPGMTQADLSQMKQKMQEEVNTANKRDVFSGERTSSKKIHTLMVAVKEKAPVYMEVMPSPDKMQSLDYYKLYRDSICAVYGVTPIFVGVIESGKSGNNPRMQIDVQKGTTEEHQRFLEDLWNNKVLPLFGVTDWEIQFGSIEAVDELRQAQVWKEKATAAQTLMNLGFVVTFDEHGNLEVSLEPEEKPEQPEEPEEEAKPVDEEDVSEASGEWSPKKIESDFPDKSAAKIRHDLENTMLKIMSKAKKVNDIKKSYAAAKKAMEEYQPKIIEAARVALSHTMETDLPQVPPKILKKLSEEKKERLKDIRKLLREELKRKEE